MLDSLFPIALFPTSGLASSVIVPVWIGVLVVAFFNLRFGWVLSGIVVPGYLVPMLIVNPSLAIVNYIEALITLLLAMFISNRVAIWANWSHFFGRDRFFLILLVSVFVRLTLDTWGFDLLSDAIYEYNGERVLFRNDLHSFGLIIIALMSNQMWKTGVVRGSFHMAVTVGVTLIIVRYVLMTYTNFSLTNLAFMYEEVSVAILASPKSYMILLVSCYVASRMNLRYGWEYAGILVPSLLAIQWYQPLKIVATFAETFVILGLASLLLRNRFITNMGITGARKLVLFFTVSFAYKVVLALSIGVIAPYQKASDFFAFGYLLSTLIAIKMHDKNLVIGMSRTVLQSSLVALMFATIIGFSLFKVVPSLNQHWFSNELVNERQKPLVIESDTDLVSWLIKNRSKGYELQEQTQTTTQSLKSVSQFREAMSLLMDYRVRRDNKALLSAQTILAGIGAKLQKLEGRYLVISHDKDATFGNYAINLDKQSKELLIQAPRGLSERQSYNTALALFNLNDAAYLAISNGLVVSGASDLTNSNSIFNHFQMLTAKNNVVQVRTTPRNAAERARLWSKDHVVEEGEIFAWVKRAIPTGLNLNQILKTLPNLSLNWFTPSFTNRQRDLSNRAFVEFLFDRSTALKIQTLARLSNQQPILEEDRLSIDGYLQGLLTDKKLLIAEKNSEAYQVPELGEMLLILDEVVSEVLSLIESDYIKGRWTELGYTKLSQVNRLLGYFNYQLIQYRDINAQETFIVISEVFGPHAPRHWGTYVFRLNGDSSFVVEVPRPIFERRTLELGLHAFQTLKAKALFIAGAHPQTNIDASSDILKLRNRRNLFTTMHYGIARHYTDDPLHFAQIRSMSSRQRENNVNVDVIIDGTATDSRTRDLFANYFSDQSLNVKIASSNSAEVAATTGVSELGINGQTAQLRYQKNKAVSVAWVSSDVRQRFRHGESLTALSNQLAVSNIKVETIDVSRHIDEVVNEAEYSAHRISDRALEQLVKYTNSQNIVDLHNAIDIGKLHIVGFMDTVSNQLILEVSQSNSLVGFLNINPVSFDQNSVKEINGSAGQHFVEGRYVWLGLIR